MKTIKTTKPYAICAAVTVTVFSFLITLSFLLFRTLYFTLVESPFQTRMDKIEKCLYEAFVKKTLSVENCIENKEAKSLSHSDTDIPIITEDGSEYQESSPFGFRKLSFPLSQEEQYLLYKQHFPWLNSKLYSIIVRESIANDINPSLVMSVIHYESQGKVKALGKEVSVTIMQSKSKKKVKVRAIGLMQVMPFNYSGNLKDLYKPEINIAVGAKYLKYCMELSSNKYFEGLKNYNSGYKSSFYNYPYIRNVLDKFAQTSYVSYY